MAHFAGFIAGSYQSTAYQADAEQSINYFPEAIEVQSGRTKTSYTLLSKPGFRKFARVSASGIRAEAALNARAWFIAASGANNVFYELKADGTTTSYGNIPGDRRPQIAPGEKQLLVLAGGIGYGFDLVTNSLTRITSAGFPLGAIKAGVSDSYNIVLEPNSQTFAISALNNVFAWDALDFGDVEGEPGNIVTFVVDHRQLWFFGNNHGEVFYDSGNADFPFTRLDGAYFEQGACGVDAAFPCDNTVFWLGKNRDGEGIAWRASNYTPVRISTHAIENLIAKFGDLSSVSGYCHQEKGHTFARWDFPNAYAGRGASLLYDVATKFWHERAFWNAKLGQYMADLARTHMYVWGKHLVGDWRSGTIYEQSQKFKSDDGAAIRRLRAAPDLANGGKWTFYEELRLLMDVGKGLDGAGGGSTPAPAAPGPFFTLETLSGTIPSSNNFANTATSDPSPWYLSAIHSATAEGVTATDITIHAGGNTYGPYTIDAGETLVILPPIPVTASDTFTLTNTALFQLILMASTSATSSGFKVAPALIGTGVTLLDRDGTPDQMTATLADFTITGGLAAPIAFPGATDVILTDPPGLEVTDVSPVASAAWAANFTIDSFISPASGTLEWLAISPGGASDIPEGGAPCGDGTDPKMVLQISNDGGKTWSSERAISMGKKGDYKKLMRWSRLGRSMNRVFRVICSEPVDASLVACELDTQDGR